MSVLSRACARHLQVPRLAYSVFPSQTEEVWLHVGNVLVCELRVQRIIGRGSINRKRQRRHLRTQEQPSAFHWVLFRERDVERRHHDCRTIEYNSMSDGVGIASCT
jgi:hypothetical protein